MISGRRIVSALAGTALVMGACSAPQSLDVQAPQPKPQQVKEAPVSETAETTQRTPTLTDTQMPGGVSKAAAEKFKSWGIVHWFLGATVMAGKVISPTEAISLTKDNHVGVTKDGGKTWSFIRHVNGKVQAVAGAPGGPYVATGKLGYVALSTDGKLWSDLPRLTVDDLIGVAVANGSVVAIGKKGMSVRFNTDGRGLWRNLFPDKFKAKAIFFHNGGFYAVKGKKAYKSKDGRSWAKQLEAPKLNKGKRIATSRGVCGIGKVGKTKGMICEVKGLGHGVGTGAAFVDMKKAGVAFTNNNGSSWAVSNLPFKGLSTVFGNPAGPYYAIGKKGSLAISTDGKRWTLKPLNATKTLQAGIISGSNVIIVGDKGTIVRSQNNGESWEVIPAPMNKAFKSILKRGNKLVIPIKKTAIESIDGGKTWTEITDPTIAQALPQPGKPGDCLTRVPNTGEICKFQRAVKSPLGYPKVRSFHFSGDVGLAVGDAGLVMFTQNGGAKWEAKRGFKFKGLQDFAVRGKTIIAIGGKSVVYSVNGGLTFNVAQLPKKIGKIQATHISADGAVYAVGTKGTILKASGNLTAWLPSYTFPKNKTKYTGIYEVNGILYAVGKKGELDRSQDKGQRWRRIPSGVKSPILKMAGEGNTVVAIASPGRKTGNLLLRSNNGGQLFFVQRELSSVDRPHEFWLKTGVLRFNGRVSSDFGATWTPAMKNYHRWSESAGQGIQIANYRRYKAKDVFYVFGPEAGDWTIVDSFFNKNAWFRCDPTNGCWMVVSGQVYRPL